MARMLGRTKDHREQTLRNAGCSLVLAGSIRTTVPKAKEVRSLVERWLTHGKQVAAAEGSARLAGYRRLLAAVGDVKTAKLLMGELATRTKDRQSGYLRLLRTGHRRGDAAPVALLTFVDQPAPVAKQSVGSKTTKKES